MARTFQNVRLFRQMTVLENVMIGNRRHIHYNVADGLLHTKKWKQGEETSKAACCEILERIGLLDEKDELCSNLPYGKQKSWKSPARWQVSRGCSYLTNPQPA